MRDFDTKIRNNNKVTSNKTKQREKMQGEKELCNHITSYLKLINDLAKEVTLILTKGLEKDLEN